jgi:hypothetical protein
MNPLTLTLSLDNILLTPDRSPGQYGDALTPMLSQVLDDHTVSKAEQDKSKLDVLWPKERYGLERSGRFMQADMHVQHAILKSLTEYNMSLSYWIEKSGHQYGAKMILLAQTLQEKSLYALFAAEEAIHLQEFIHFMNFTPIWDEHHHPMLIPLVEAMASGEREALIFIIQVLLEGFGLSHYHGLMATCTHPDLKRAYQRILKDEARHHGAGLILTHESVPTQRAKDQIFEYSRAFIKALQGAHWIKKAVEKHTGSMSTLDEKKFWQELDQQRELAARRQKLREMLEKVDRYGLVASLESDGVL